MVLSNTAAEYFPRGLNKKFPNLKALMLKNSGLKEISMQDLIGVEKLETLLFLSEKLESLPDNLLTHMRKLSRITFYGNELEFVSSTLLAPIINNEIKRIRFYTPKIKAGYGPDYYEPNKVETLQELINIIYTNGKKMTNEESSSLYLFQDAFLVGFKAIWLSGQFSDFVITVGQREFRVHKTVLALQSSVFSKIFQESWTTEMEIKEIKETVEDFLEMSQMVRTS